MSTAWEPKVGDVIEGYWPTGESATRGRVLGVCGGWLWVQPFYSQTPTPQTWDASSCIPIPSLLEAAGNLIEVYATMSAASAGSFQPAWTAFVAAYERAKEEEEE